MWPLVVLCLLFNPTNAQFAEIASIATSLLGSGLGPALGGAAAAGSAASPALGALSQIGQLYQLAQGALQLTGTGVGVLNQASEGNWFPAVLEQASKNTKTLMGGAGGLGGPPNLGALGPGRTGVSGSVIGPEFGTGFPAPSIEDYTDNVDKSDKKPTKTPESLVDIDDNDFDELTPTTSTASPTPTDPVTLFPDESNSVTEATTVQLKEIRIELPKGTDTDTDVDYIDRVTTDGDSRVQVTNKAKSTEDENLLAPDRASAAKTLNAKTRTGVPDLTRLIDVLRKSNLKEAEIMEIVSQVEGNDNNPPPAKIDFTSAVQNIPLKKHLNRERIVKASREINRNIGPHEKELESHLNHFHHQLPNPAASGAHSGITPTTALPSPTQFTQFPTHPNQQGFLGTNRLEREISAVPAGKAPVQVSPPPNPALLLPQAQFTPPPAYLFQHHWHNPQFSQPHLPAAPHSPQLYQPQANPAQPPAHAFAHPPYFHQFPYQPFHLQQQYTSQLQNPTVPAHIQSAPPPLNPNFQQQHQQVPNPQHFQAQQQLQQHQQSQIANPPYQGQQSQYSSQQNQQNYHYSTQQQVAASQPQPYRQFRQISGQAYQSQGVQARPVVYTNQPAGAPAEYNRVAHVALSAPIRQGNTVLAQGPVQRNSHVAARAVHPGPAPANSGKTRGVGYSSRQRSERDTKAPPSVQVVRSVEVSQSAHLVESSVRAHRSVTDRPQRKYPVRTVRTQGITTPAPQVKLPDGIFAQGGLLVNADPEKRTLLSRRFIHRHQHSAALARASPSSRPYRMPVSFPPRRYPGIRSSLHFNS